MRSSSYCVSCCTPPLCYLPCLPKSKDDEGGDPKSKSSSLTAVTEDRPPMVQKIEEFTMTEVTDSVGDDDNCYREVAVASKSCLKRANCEGDIKIAAKGNVKWRDLQGKDLAQVQEFEPRCAPYVVQKIEESTATKVTSSDSDDDKYFGEVVVAPKSCLKRANCKDNSKKGAKGNVKWRDLLGKDLTQVKEFEPSEFGDSEQLQCRALFEPLL